MDAETLLLKIVEAGDEAITGLAKAVVDRLGMVHQEGAGRFIDYALPTDCSEKILVEVIIPPSHKMTDLQKALKTTR